MACVHGDLYTSPTIGNGFIRSGITGALETGEDEPDESQELDSEDVLDDFEADFFDIAS